MILEDKGLKIGVVHGKSIRNYYYQKEKKKRKAANHEAK